MNIDALVTVTPAAARPSIDVVIPAYNEADCIDRCLDHVLAQDYPPELVRIFVVDAGSSDATAARVLERKDPRIRLLGDGQRRNAGQAMALGTSAGEGALIARVDAHTYLASDYLHLAAELMATEGGQLALVGGQPEQEGENRFGMAVALARRSRFGVGGSVYADRRSRAYVDSVQGGVYRRAALEAVGGFAENMLVSEDEELNWRLRKAGHRILLDVRLRFKYQTRSTWRGLFRQYRNYGRSRARVLAAHPDFLKPRHLAPSGVVLGGGSLLLAAVPSRRARQAFAIMAALYGALAAAASALVAGVRDPGLALRVAACYPALHIAYGEGLLEEAAAMQLERLGVTQTRKVVTRR